MIKTIAIVDYEVQDSYRLVIEARDDGKTLSLSSTCVVEINIIDINDYPPLFSQNKYVKKLYEEVPIYTYVLQVSASDADRIVPNSDIVYHIFGGNEKGVFTIDPPKSGMIKTIAIVDYEVQDSCRLVIEARDDGKTLSLSSTCVVEIIIIDINDNPPLFSQNKYVKKLYEEVPINTYVLQVSASDADSIGPNSDIVYRIVGGNETGVLTKDPPKSGMIKTIAIVYYEVQNSYRLVIKARDNGTVSLSSTCVVEINIIDINDNPPLFSQNKYVTEMYEEGPINTYVMKVSASDADSIGPNSDIVYRIIG
ncbi:protocadherin Fat 3-like [Dreissena polymorpha]|uniref:protocadherin Fat 3-like n=1 Tax=Dreissena polymorpha TaxID=45954 RepID=UPI002263DDE2|nr:protocadherin Fat 3-like [Dreissena polymorpha]